MIKLQKVVSTAKKLRWTTVVCSTINEAEKEVSGCHVVIAALGTNKETFLFNNTALPSHSTLLEKTVKLSIPLVVFSHTATSSAKTTAHCVSKGANFVINSTEALETILSRFTVTVDAPTPSSVASSTPISTTATSSVTKSSPHDTENPSAGRLSLLAQIRCRTTTASNDATAAGTVPLLVGGESDEVKNNGAGCPLDAPSHCDDNEYPSLKTRFAILRNGPTVDYVKMTNKNTKKLIQMSNAIKGTALLDRSLGNNIVRFVAISDTHTLHRHLKLPAGDVLIHAGDFVGNYSYTAPLERQALDFAAWLGELPFKLIIVLAGNHETFLDSEKYPKLASTRAKFLSALPPNAIYLENSGISYRGINIWGSPIVTCRKEKYGKHYISDGFERVEDIRAKVWERIPSNTDILVTHSPPVHEAGDALLQAALDGVNKSPSVHIWGHDHGYHGAGVTTVSSKGGVKKNLLWFNCAQNGLLNHESVLGGFPWVVDLPARDVAETL
jgi:hypothetical protein